MLWEHLFTEGGGHLFTEEVFVIISLEKAMAPHSSTLAWQIPWTEEPERLQSMGSLRIGHDWATSLSLFTFMHWRRKWQPTPVFLPGESQEWRSLVFGVAQSWTQLKWLSNSSIFPWRSEASKQGDVPAKSCCSNASAPAPTTVFYSEVCIWEFPSGEKQNCQLYHLHLRYVSIKS